MRISTFAFSFLVHMAAAAALMATRIFAATDLPTPPSSTRFVAVAIESPTMPAAPPSPAARAEPQPMSDAVPLSAPDTIAPEPAAIPDRVSPNAAVPLVGGDAVGGLPGPPPRTPPPPAPQPIETELPRRVGGIVRAPQKVHHVAPVYPELARAARVGGVVILEALIGEDGAVRSVAVLRAHPLLETAAVEAVRQWRFTPPMLNNVPIQVLMTVTVNFTLH